MSSEIASIPSTLHANAHDLAKALRDFAREDIRAAMSLVPYKRFDPDNTFWWICPGYDMPAFRYGKYLVRTAEPPGDMVTEPRGDVSAEPRGDLFAGICFEKGLGDRTAEILKGTRAAKTWIVRPNWIWNSFIAALSDGTFDLCVADAQLAAERPVDIMLTAGVVSPPAPGDREGDDERRLVSLPSHRLVYSYDSSRLTLVHEHCDGDKLIAHPATCQSLPELASQIGGIDRLDWIWVHIEFGFFLSTTPNACQMWHTETIWDNACEPFLEWFR